jgi:hypothetical protein
MFQNERHSRRCRRTSEDKVKATNRWLGVVALGALCACGKDNTNFPSSGTSGGTTGGSTGSGNANACTASVDGAALSQGAGLVPSVSAMAGGLAAAWLEKGEVVVALVDAKGAASHRTVVSTSAGKAALPSVIPTSGGFIALWAEAATVMGRALNSSLAPSGAPFIVQKTASTEPRPTGVSGGNVAFAAWMNQPTLVAAAVSPGTMQQRGTANGWYPAIGSDGSRVALAWSAGGKQGPVHVTTIDAMGSGVDVPGSVALIKSVTVSGTSAYVGWEDIRTGTEVVQLARIDLTAGKLGATAAASPSGGSANWPALASGGGQVGVAYYQFRDNSPTLFFQVFDGNLQPISGEFVVSEDAKYPSVAYVNGSWAIAFNKVNGPAELSVVKCP